MKTHHMSVHSCTQLPLYSGQSLYREPPLYDVVLNNPSIACTEDFLSVRISVSSSKEIYGLFLQSVSMYTYGIHKP